MTKHIKFRQYIRIYRYIFLDILNFDIIANIKMQKYHDIHQNIAIYHIFKDIS